jgi:hypothetical protein
MPSGIVMNVIMISVTAPNRVTRLGDFSPIGLLFVGSLKKYPQNGNTLGYKFITFSTK